MADERIIDLPVLPFPNGTEELPTDHLIGGTRKIDLNALGAFIGTLLGNADFVFQPGGVASGNVFTSFAALQAAASGVPAGLPKRIFLDGTFNGGVVIIPPGSWFFSGEYQIIGIVNGGGISNRPSVVFSPNCVFSRWPALIEGILLTDQNALFSLFGNGGGGGGDWCKFSSVDVLGSAGLPLLMATIGGMTPRVFLSRSTVELATLVDTLSVPSSIIVVVENGSVLGPNTVAANPTALIQCDASSRASSIQSASASVEFTSEWSSQSTFVYDPTATPPFDANVYTDWSELDDVVNTVSGDITIIFPVDVTIPSDAGYDFDRQNVYWVGGGNTGGLGARPIVQGAPGVQVRGLRGARNLALKCVDGADLLRSPSGNISWFYDFENVQLEPLGAAAAVILHDQQGVLTINFRGACEVIFGGGAPAIRGSLNLPGTFVVNTYDESQIDSNAIETPALYAATLRMLSPTGGIAPQPTMLGPTTTFLGPDDPRVRHTLLADAAAWAPPAPATVQEAISRLAVAVFGLLGGPIP